MTETKKQTRYMSFLLCVVMLLTLVLTSAFAQSEVSPAEGSVNPMVRVLLKRLNIVDRMDVVLNSPYGMNLSGNMEMYFEKGSVLSFRMSGGEIYLYYEDMRAKLGQECILKRYVSEEETGFSLTNFPAVYKGDLRLKTDGDRMLPILAIHVEDYLQGVVPYEMSEYFPMEALKAQTVAARTYVLKKQNDKADYDVVDTTSDQAFKGYMPGFSNCMQAIRDTEGVCGFYKGELAQCYYSASNGGRTELVESVWGDREDYGYYASIYDPYDLENPASIVQKTTLHKIYTNKGKDTAPYGLRTLLASALKEELVQLGLDPAPESIQVSKIHSLSVDTVERENEVFLPARNITMEISINGRTREDPSPLPSATLTILDTQSPVNGGESLPVNTPQITPAPTPEPVYGKFVPIETVFAVEIPIFPMAESAFGMSISANYENEIWSVAEDKKTFTLEARRHGHGVGMSQRGAEWMAKTYGKTYLDILNFYYPGMDLKRYEYANETLPEAPEALLETMGPALSPTPRPTLMPLNASPEKGQWIAVVTEIDDDSSLNLRSRPGLNGEILMRLYKHQRLLVLERCPEEGWVKVRTDTAEGYVMESYLSRE